MSKMHTYGSGEVSFAQFLPGTQNPGARRYLGNTTEFTLTSEIESLDHFDTDHGIRVKDDSVTTSLNQSGTVVTDNIDPKNVALFFFGTTMSLVNAAGTGTVDTIANVQYGVYQLGTTNANPTGVRKVSGAVVASGATTFVAAEDYVIDAEYGTIEFLEGGDVEEGTSVTVTYSSAATTREQVISGNQTVEGAIHFKSFNAVGPQRDYFMPWAKLTPNGDFALKGEDWLTIPFNIEVLKKGSLAAVYADGVAMVG